ncbi:MAG: efflux RND transporter permease subunit [Gammaproteobacteria bacterium]|nr:efflux RND transporter permease subunit [Gammaproteobacteria bacterium]
MTLPEIAVKRPVATIMALVSILVLGLIALFRLELGFMPETEEKRLIVIANYNNASPKSIERMIIKPIEDAVSSMGGLEHIWAHADSNGGRVNLSFALEVDMALARVEIHERLDRIKNELPEDLERLIISENWNPRETGETIMEARISSGRDLSKNYEVLDRKIIRPLQRIPGVAVVTLDGVNPREIRINLDLMAIKRFNIDPRSVWRDISLNHQNAAIGVIRNDERKITLRSVGEFTSVEEIENLKLSQNDLKIKDIAEVSYEEPPLEYGRHLDGQFAIGLNIAKESSANTISISDAVYQKLESMKEDPELAGINFLVWQDQGKEIRNTLGDLRQTGMFGAILASLILFMFLRRLTSTLVAVFCIPFSLIVACGVIWLQGKTMNTISLLGLIVGLGMLVDNAVVIMENIDRYQRKGYTGRVASILGSKEVSIAVITATVTSLIVFLPMIFSKPTNMNVVLQELGITISITLLASLFISQTLIPLASSKLLKDRQQEKPTPIMDKLKEKYGKILSYTLKRPKLVIPTAVCLILLTIYPTLNLNINMDHSRSEMFVGIRVDISEPLSLEARGDIVKQVESALMPHKERLNVDSVYSWWASHIAIVRLYMKTGYQNDDAMNQIRKELPKLLPKIAGVNLQVQDNGPFWQRNTGKRVAVMLRGPDSDTLGKLAEEALGRIEGIEGLFDFYANSEGGQLELQAQLNRDRLSSYGVAADQPASLIEMTFRGRQLPRYKGEDGEVEMRLLLDENLDTTIGDLKSLTVYASGVAVPNQSQAQVATPNQVVPLESVAKFSVQKSPGRIQRENKYSSVWVGARFDEGKRADFHQQLVAKLKSMSLPEGYEWEFNPRWRGAGSTEKEFVLNLILALGLIFAVMAGLFESVRQAIALMISLPFALAGAIWTLFIFSVDFDQPASIAVLLLLGIVVNNGIVMIEHINMYRRDGMERTKAMILGGQERLRPIIMTALTTLMGLVPLIIQKPTLAGVYYYSMAYVIIGGLLFSTILTAIFLPATICLVEDVGSFIYRAFHRSDTVSPVKEAS